MDGIRINQDNDHSSTSKFWISVHGDVLRLCMLLEPEVVSTEIKYT